MGYRRSDPKRRRFHCCRIGRVRRRTRSRRRDACRASDRTHRQSAARSRNRPRSSLRARSILSFTVSTAMTRSAPRRNADMIENRPSCREFRQAGADEAAWPTRRACHRLCDAGGPIIELRLRGDHCGHGWQTHHLTNRHRCLMSDSRAHRQAILGGISHRNSRCNNLISGGAGRALPLATRRATVPLTPEAWLRSAI